MSMGSCITKYIQKKNKDIKAPYVFTICSRAFIRFSWDSVSGTYMSIKVNLVGKTRIKKRKITRRE